MSKKLKVSELKPFPKNNIYFDDVSGEQWRVFVESIKTSGVIEPIVVTQDNVIVSGHQRVRACKELGVKEIDAEVRTFDSEDEIIKQLIETNIRQRGVGNPNPTKFGFCLQELDRIYGIEHGGDRKSQSVESRGQDGLLNKTQEELANELGISLRTWKRYEQLSKTIPEIQDLVNSNIVTPTVALAITSKLPIYQQVSLVDQLAKNGVKATAPVVNEMIEEIKEDSKENPEDTIAQMEEQLEARSKEIESLKKQWTDLEIDAEKEGLTTKEMFYKNKIKLLEDDAKKMNDSIVELNKQIDESKKEDDQKFQEGEEAKSDLLHLKTQMAANAKMELADFYNRYSEVMDVKKLIKDFLKKI